MNFTLTDTIERELTELDSQIKKSKEMLEEDFLYNFEWGYPADIYKKMDKRRHLMAFLEFVKQYPSDVVVWLQDRINGITANLTSGDYSGRSTSDFHNLAHVYKLEVLVELLKHYKAYLLFITAESDPMLIS